MAVRHPYVRPMQGWWKRNPYFMRYMAREATAIFVVAYALILLAGLVRLAQGEAAFAQWRDGLRSPWSIAFHIVLLGVFAYHTWSWFRIMPKTLPPLVVAGRRLTPGAITVSGLAASVIASLVLLAAWTWLAR
jgi:fumarate reductase subunit C